MKECMEEEYEQLINFIQEQNIFDKGIMIVFALLSKSHLQLYEDMHMSKAPIKEFDF